MKSFIAALAFVGALVGVLAGPLAQPTAGFGPAQQQSLSATLSPTYVTPGCQVTVTSTQPCPQPMDVFWSLGPGAMSGSVTTNTEGSWVVRFTAPRTPGASPFFAHCAFGPNSAASAMYRQLNFTIVAARPPRYTG